jgi:multicomponent Na+:H+ antiporter subunit G
VNWTDYTTTACIILGCFFFLAGTVGLLRLPDVFTRLHALTKADNVGLGLIALGAAFQVDTVANLVKVFLIWILVLITSATIAHLVARSALLQGEEPWKSP